MQPKALFIFLLQTKKQLQENVQKFEERHENLALLHDAAGT